MSQYLWVVEGNGAQVQWCRHSFGLISFRSLRLCIRISTRLQVLPLSEDKSVGLRIWRNPATMWTTARYFDRICWRGMCERGESGPHYGSIKPTPQHQTCHFPWLTVSLLLSFPVREGLTENDWEWRKMMGNDRKWRDWMGNWWAMTGFGVGGPHTILRAPAPMLLTPSYLRAIWRLHRKHYCNEHRNIRFHLVFGICRVRRASKIQPRKNVYV